MSDRARLLSRALAAAGAVALLLVGASVAAAAAGQLDASYGTSGVFTGPFQTEPSGSPPHDQSAVVDSQGRTVIAATHTDAQNRRHLDVMRLTPQGALDPSFNPGGPMPGIVEVDFSAYVSTIDVYSAGVAVAGGDKIVALGWVHDTTGSNNFTALVRLNSDGSYDTTFGANHDGRTVDTANPNYIGFPDSLAVDNLGRILVGGSCGSGCGGVVVRYTTTGARDTAAFNAGDAVHPGIVAIAQGSDVSSLAMAADGSNDILAADGSSTSDTAVIARIRPDGTLDPTFNSSGQIPGVVESGMGCQACTSSGGAAAFGVAPGPGGTVYATGQVTDPSGQSMRLLRLTQAGNPDPGFGSGSPATGVVAVPGGIRGVSVTLDSSACPVIVGYGLRSDQQVPNTRIVAARFTGAGALDQAFNPTGPTPGTAAFELGDRALAETVAIQGDGNIVIGGEVDRFGTTTTRNAVALRLQGGGCGTSQPPSPTVVTGQASAINSTAATLNGTVNPNGAQLTDCHFDYGTTTSYTSSVPCSQLPAAGTSPVAVSAPISGLSPNTTYDYRLVAGSAGGTSDGNNQTFTTVAPGTPTTLSTVQVWGMMRGASITVPGSASGEHDEAQLTGANVVSSSGSFTFSLYRQAASGSQCTGTPVFTSTVPFFPVEQGGASSDPVPSTLPPGTYYWTVAYSGDVANQPSSSACGAEVLTVQPPQPTTLSTTQVWGATRGASITVPGSASGEHDEAQLTGANASLSSGSFTFNLYRRVPSGVQCTGAPVFTSIVPFFPVEQGGASSNPVPSTLPPGTYYWTVAYSGDSANQPSTSHCGAEILAVQPPQPTTLSTTQVWGATRGASITVPGSASGEHDEAQLSGENAGIASGSFTFNLYRQAPTLLQCRGIPAFTSTIPFFPVEQGGASSDPVPTTLSPGTYYWTVSYSGDGANQPSTSHCGAEVLTVFVPHIPLISGPAFTNGSVVTLALSCQIAPCVARITLTVSALALATDALDARGSKSKVITLARGIVTIRKHGAKKVTLRLTRIGRRYTASHHGRVIATAMIATTIHGHTRVLKNHLTLKIARPGKPGPH